MSDAERNPAPSAKPRGRVIAWSLVVAVVAFGVLLASWPQLFGLQRTLGVAQLIAFRVPIAIGFGVLTVLMLGIALLRLHKPGFRVAVALLLVVALGVTVNVGAIVSRGTGAAEAGEGDLTVMTWNTQGGATGPVDIARVAAAAGADIVTLPETSELVAAQVVKLLADEGINMTAATIEWPEQNAWIPTSILISQDLGTYQLDPTAGTTPGLPSGVWRLVDGAGPATIVAVHPMPPVRARMTEWSDGLHWLAQVCDSPDLIMAGDFNATLDHMSGLGVDGHHLGRCDDAATLAGSGAVGTWPSDMPTWVSAPIDHVMIGSAFDVISARVVDEAPVGSDHRPVVVELARR